MPCIDVPVNKLDGALWRQPPVGRLAL